MRRCKRCAHPVLHDEYFPPGGRNSFLPFDVLSVIESAHNPVEQEIFNKTDRPKGVYVKMFHKRTIEDKDFEGRPAIALDSGQLHPKDGELVRTRVLLTATYWGQHMQWQTLPLILQRFGVGIYQHQTIAGEPGKFHLHTWPEWINSRKGATNAWLIAREYPFEGELAERHDGRWMNVKRAKWWSCSSFTVEEEFQKEVGDVIEKEWNDWTRTCQSDPKALDRCVWEYMQFSNTLAQYRTKSGMPVPPKQTPYHNTTPIHKKVTPSSTMTKTQTMAPAKCRDSPVQMLQKKPLNSAHPSLARPTTSQSLAFAASDALARATPVDIPNDKSKLQTAATSSVSTRPAALVISQASAKPEQASTAESSSAPPPPKATYAQMLKAGATSGQTAQKPPRQMVPA